MSRIVVFGATGYTGKLTAEVLAASASGASLVLAGRNRAKLQAMAADLADRNPATGPIAVQVADVDRPDSVRALVSDPTDVLISTVGPFLRWGRPAVEAAIAAGCTYVDSTGEPAFLRRLFRQDDAPAQRSGARLLPAFGYDYVPGNLAGALALREAAASGTPATRVDVVYAMEGGVGMSSGTAATGAGIVLEPSYSFEGGRLRGDYIGHHTRNFHVANRTVTGLSLGATEHFGLPRLEPQLQDVQVFMGAAGRWSRPLSLGSSVLNAATKIPGVKTGLQGLATRVVRGSRGGPTAQQRAAITSVAVAEAFDAAGRLVAEVTVAGPSPYDLTAEALAWAAGHASEIESSGCLAPTDAFGVERFESGCAQFGLNRRHG